MGAALLVETFARLEAGDLRPIPQDHAAATLAPRMRREDGLVDWSLPARTIYNRLRGFDPWPGIHSFFRGKRLRILAARPAAEGGLRPGQLRAETGELGVGCGSGRLVLREVQLEGRRPVAALDFARGFRLGPDEVLGHG